MTENTYIIKGIVHPERAQISFGPIHTEIVLISTGLKLKIELNVVLNQVTFQIQSEEEWDIYDLRNIAKRFTFDQLTMIGFIKGYAYDIEIVQILNFDKQIDFVYGIDIPYIADRNKGKDLETELLQLRSISHSEFGIYFHRCLNDLNMAMKHAEDTGFYCFRAIESLKQYCRYKFDIESEKEQWEKLVEITGFEKSDIEFIREKAFPARHGDIVEITSKERATIFESTWKIVEIFISDA